MYAAAVIAVHTELLFDYGPLFNVASAVLRLGGRQC